MARSAIASDNFNRADGALSGNWTDCLKNAAEVVSISSNAIRTTGTDAGSRWTGAGTFTADQYSSLVVKNPGDDFSYIGVLARATGSEGTRTAYYEYVRGITGASGLVKVVNNSVTNIDTTPGTVSYSDGNRIEIECSGTSISGLKDTVVQHSATDSDITGTSATPGVFCSAASGVAPQGDDWEGGNLSASGNTTAKKLILLSL